MAFKQGTKSAFLLSCWCTSWKYNPNKTRMPSNTKIYFNNIHLCQAAKLFLLVSKKDKNTFFIKSFTLWHSLADPGISLPQSAPPAPPPSELLADMQAIIENAWWWYSEKVLELEPFPCRKLLLAKILFRTLLQTACQWSYLRTITILHWGQLQLHYLQVL